MLYKYFQHTPYPPCIVGKALIVHFAYRVVAKKLLEMGLLQKFHDLVKQDSFLMPLELWKVFDNNQLKVSFTEIIETLPLVSVIIILIISQTDKKYSRSNTAMLAGLSTKCLYLFHMHDPYKLSTCRTIIIHECITIEFTMYHASKCDNTVQMIQDISLMIIPNFESKYLK